MRKTRRIRRGGARSAENQAKINAKYSEILQNLANVKNLEASELNNQENYTKIKKTIIPLMQKITNPAYGTYEVGTTFYFRTPEPTYELKDEPMFFDYSSFGNRHTYLLQNDGETAQYEPRLSENIVKQMITKYGEYLNEVRVIKPLTVIHFPIDDTSKEASMGPHSYSAFFEEVMRNTCLGDNKACADGYTRDVFFNDEYGWQKGYREICIFNPKEHLEIVSSMSPVNQKTIYEMQPGGKKLNQRIKTLKNNLKNIYNSVIKYKSFYKENDNVYNKFKVTMIPEGREFYFRSKKNIEKLEDRPIWLEYTGSFITGEGNKLPEIVSKKIIERFGNYVCKVRVKKSMNIIHFPVDYSSQEASINNHSYSAYSEPVVRTICTKTGRLLKYIKSKNTDDIDYSKGCADGYTLDFLYRGMPGYKSSWIPNNRELVVYHPQEHLEIVECVERP